MIEKNPNVKVNVALVRGERGPQGQSAYEIAIKNGYIGTEQEWLNSLKGEDGYTPVKGKDYFTAAEIEEIKNECKYDDEELTNRVTNLETTVGTLNDSLEAALNGE